MAFNEASEVGARFRALANAMVDGVIVIDQDGAIQSFNASAERIFGYRADEAIGENVKILMPAPYRDEHDTHINDYVLTGHAKIIGTSREVVGQRKDGSVFPMNLSVGEFPDHGRRYFVGIARDISAEKEAETARIRSEDLYRRLLEAIPDAIWVTALDDIVSDKIVYANQAAADLLRAKDKTELVGRQSLDFVHPDDREEVVNRRRIVAQGGDTHAATVRRLRFDGEAIETETSAILVVWGDHPAILVIARDITERKRVEDELRESERRYRSLVDDSPVPMMVVGETAVLYANAAAAHLYGFPSTDELIGTPAIDRIHPDDREAWTARRKGLHRQAEPMPLIEQHRLRADGSVVNVLSRGLFIQWEGQPAILGIQIDISDQRRTEKQLYQAQKMEAIGQLTGGIAHDFNNLLAVLMMDLEELALRHKGDEETEVLVEEAQEIAHSGADLTSRLLAFSRQQDLDPREVRLEDLIRECMALLRRTIGEHIDLDIIMSRDLWSVVVDRRQLENALLNLAINARDVMPSGGKITFDAHNVYLDEDYTSAVDWLEQGEYVQLNVTDTGPGVPKEIQEKVFDPFFTTKEPGSGTGLGLSMVYGFLKQSGGHISIYSEEDHGTTFSLYLPRTSSDSDLRRRTEPAVAEEPRGSETILLVEDFPQLRKRGAQMLADLGYRVIEADNGNEALGELEAASRVDLLFTDIVMPGGMNGFELAEMARKYKPDLKVLYTSGYAEGAEVEIGILDTGAIRLHKPYSRQDLARTIRRVLDTT